MDEGMLIPNRTLTAEEAESLRQQWEARYAGTDNATPVQIMGASASIELVELSGDVYFPIVKTQDED